MENTRNNIVDVAVDLPIQQVDNLYSYLVPNELVDQSIVGKRVLINFNGRHLIGFVISQRIENDNNIKLKTIEGVLDQKPILNRELIELSKWIADYFYATRFAVISTMIPNKYKVKYSKNYHLIDEIDEELFSNLFLGLDYLPINAKHITDYDRIKLSTLIKQGIVEIDTNIQMRDRLKKQIAVFFNYDFLDWDDIKLNDNQKHIINFLKQSNEKIVPVNELVTKTGLSKSTINTLIKKKILQKTEIVITKNALDEIHVEQDEPLKFNNGQQLAFNEIKASLIENKNDKFLLEGITGSGKTEIYLQLIEETIKLGKTVILLVPEITLTSQIVRRVKSRFGNIVGLQHSELNDTQRLDQWKMMQDGGIKIIVGTRSAIFSPLDNIGLIIIDEEHDLSYKQDENPRYHTRDVAIKRSENNNAVLVLGSATPSLESRARALKKVFKLILLNERANKDSKLPKIQIVDLKETYKQKGETNFSDQLLNKIKDHLSNKKQIVLLLNRRGFSNFLMCRDCGYVPHDKNCDVALTVHKDIGKLKCHYCGNEETIPTVCANCRSKNISFYGTGTQSVEQELHQLIPEVKTVRMDADTTSKKGSSDKIIQDFADLKYDVLIGTQMISKGLDFPNVTLVGVINADTGLNLPDFRSGEKTFDLLTQVAGRAGRDKERGEVIFQTFNPDNYIIQFAAKHDYEGFFQNEMRYRHLMDYPPYFYTVRISLSGLNDLKTSLAIEQIKMELENKIESTSIIVGPSARSIAKIKNRFFYQFLIKYKKDLLLDQAIKEVQKNFYKNYGKEFKIAIDREPQSFI
ncbi:MAG: primosomal protein N' [Lactobacillaceae bacterium]|jgi:primosomal protein N' (replication factor Y)|nr:primosomal protein N' [Lactobacillaceae bacterium]